MTRPIYENSTNRKNEIKASQIIGQFLECSVVQNKKLYPADFSLIKNKKLKAIGEIKVRNNAHDKYDTFFISADKIVKCKAFSKEFGIPFFLFVWWTDGLYGLDMTNTTPSFLDIGGRYDRGDSQDVEPMAHYSYTLFKMIAPADVMEQLSC